MCQESVTPLRTVLIVIAALLLAIVLVPRLVDRQQEAKTAAQVRQMQADNEALFQRLAHDHMRAALMNCARFGLGSSCKQEALFDCQQLYGNRCTLQN